MDRAKDVDEDHDDLFWRLPWKVNGTLGHDEGQRVDAHVARCAVCRRELEALQRLSVAVQSQSVIDGAQAQNLADVQRRIAAGKAAEPARKWRSDLDAGGWPGVRHLFGGSQSRRAGFAALAAVVVALGLTGAQQVRRHAGLTTVTSPYFSGAGPVLRVRTAPGVGAAALLRLAAPLGLEIVEGPSPGWVYTLRGGDMGALLRSANMLADAPDIVIVVVREEP